MLLTKTSPLDNIDNNDNYNNLEKEILIKKGEEACNIYLIILKIMKLILIIIKNVEQIMFDQYLVENSLILPV